MIRRLALAACAVLTATSLASCGTFSDNDAVARVGDVELARDDVAELLGLTGPLSSLGTASTDPVDAELVDDTIPDEVAGDAVRAALTQWIRVALLETAVGQKSNDDISSPRNLEIRLTEGQTALATTSGDGGRAGYEAGLPTSPTICLGAIPVNDADGAQTVMDALAGGDTFADAAKEFSIDPGLAANGGIITGQDGAECLASSSLNADIAASLTGKPLGTPVILALDTLTAVVQLRPYDELSDAAKEILARAALPDETFDALLAARSVYVDPYYGYWDTATASVLPLGG